MTSDTAWNTSLRSEPATASTALDLKSVPLSLGRKARERTHRANGRERTSVDFFTSENVPTCMGNEKGGCTERRREGGREGGREGET